MQPSFTIPLHKSNIHWVPISLWLVSFLLLASTSLGLYIFSSFSRVNILTLFLVHTNSICTISLQILFGLLRGLEPSISHSIHFFTQSLSAFRNTHPYHRCSTENMSCKKPERKRWHTAGVCDAQRTGRWAVVGCCPYDMSVWSTDSMQVAVWWLTRRPSAAHLCQTTPVRCLITDNRNVKVWCRKKLNNTFYISICSMMVSSVYICATLWYYNERLKYNQKLAETSFVYHMEPQTKTQKGKRN